MKQYFHFGEVVAGYDVRVLNEREARAAAGLLFVCAFIRLSRKTSSFRARMQSEGSIAAPLPFVG